MKGYLFLLVFVFLKLSLCAQDTVYYSMGNSWGGALLLKKGKNYLVQSYFPNGNLRMKGTLKDFTYEFPERKSGRGSTAYSYLTGKTLENTIKVPQKDVVVWNEDGTVFQEFIENMLNIYDSQGNDSCKFYFSKRNKIDSCKYYYGNGEVKLKTFGNESTSSWIIQATYIGGSFISINPFLPATKHSFFPTGELECKWNYFKKNPQHKSYYTREFYAKSGEISTALIQTNDNHLTGALISYYHSGAVKSIETIYRDKRNGGYKLFTENGQLIEQSSQRDRKIDSVKVLWFENGQMKEWEDENRYYSWFQDGALRQEHGGRYGLNFDYDLSGNITRSNYLNIGHLTHDSLKVISHGERDASGLRHGIWKGYYPDSTLAYQSHFVNGIQDGELIIYYTNGHPRYLREFQLGVMHGRHTNYNRNGSISNLGYYKDGRQNGDWIDYRADGSTFRITRYSYLTRKVLLRQYDSDSTVSVASTIDSVENEIRTEYFQDGNLYLKKVVNFNGRQTLEQHWYKNGQMKSSEEFFYDAKKQSIPYVHRVPIYDSIGNVVKYKDSSGYRIPRTKRRYAQDGTLEMESTYGFKGKKNIFKTYHRNGKLNVHSVSSPDKINRTTNITKYYSDKGKLIRTEVSLNGELIRTKEEKVDW
ncbi:MAG: antitoxin component YwqK of YwqJK toxin-antitoxin module [Crocinitomicaceae bacterium]|jgi:antitoxin component YwqK of YwqJK toxin-antitoxin module